MGTRSTKVERAFKADSLGTSTPLGPRQAHPTVAQEQDSREGQVSTQSVASSQQCSNTLSDFLPLRRLCCFVQVTSRLNRYIP